MGEAVTAHGVGEELLVEARDGVRLVTLNRPNALNATDEALHGQIARIWAELDADPSVRAIVLTGSGRAFCAGGDLDLLDRMVRDTAIRDRIMTEGAEIVRTMTSVRVPIIAAVNGPAVGLGCSLAAMSDLVIVEEQATSRIPTWRLGWWPLMEGDSPGPS